MKIFVHLVASIFGGYLLHQTGPLFGRLSDRLSTLARYAAGTISMFPFIVALYSLLSPSEYDRRKPSIPNRILRLTVAYFGTAFTFGTGVFIGYFLDPPQDC